MLEKNKVWRIPSIKNKTIGQSPDADSIGRGLAR